MERKRRLVHLMMAVILGVVGPGWAVLECLRRAMLAVGMRRPGNGWLRLLAVCAAFFATAHSKLNKNARVIIPVGGSAYYSVNPSTFNVLAEVKILGNDPYKKDKHGDLPSCHTKLYFQKPGSIYYPFAPSEYEGLLPEVADYMPEPRNWEGWLSGAEDCNQDADLVCKTRVVCSLKQTYYSATIPESFGGDLVMVTDEWVSSPDRVEPIRTDKCTLCVPTVCANASCTEGRIQGVPLKAIANHVYQRPSCPVTCTFGTFLTCNTRTTCTYQVPTTDHVQGTTGKNAWEYLNDYTTKSDINMGGIWPLPVSSCYPCKYANGRTHFGQYFGTDNSLFQDDFLQFMCPGEASAPVACGRNMVSKFDSGGVSGKCECMNGYYRKNAGDAGCTMCPPGFKCAWNGMTPPAKVECELDTYSYEGASKCRSCTVNTNICPKTQALTRCVSGNDGEYQSKDAYCTDCSTCRQITNAAGSVPCNRVISVVSANGTAIN